MTHRKTQLTFHLHQLHRLPTFMLQDATRRKDYKWLQTKNCAQIACLNMKVNAYQNFHVSNVDNFIIPFYMMTAQQQTYLRSNGH